LFERLLQRLAQDEGLTVLLLPRTPDQLRAFEEHGLGAVTWRGEPLDGRQLVAGADAVVSAGGSMNREAAVLGTPAYSIYGGRVAAVDRALAAEDRLSFLTIESDVDTLTIRRKESNSCDPVEDTLLQAFVDRIMRVAG
jgi:predicted glycosyltransferase